MPCIFLSVTDYIYVCIGFMHHAAVGTRASGAKFTSYKLRLRTGTGAIRNRITAFSGPRCKSFQAVVGILDKAKAGFKGLEKYPETTGETGDGPCHKNEEDQPKEGKARIVHCCCWMNCYRYLQKCNGSCLCDHTNRDTQRHRVTGLIAHEIKQNSPKCDLVMGVSIPVLAALICLLAVDLHLPK
jgi:hypothetical protein